VFGVVSVGQVENARDGQANPAVAPSDVWSFVAWLGALALTLPIIPGVQLKRCPIPLNGDHKAQSQPRTFREPLNQAIAHGHMNVVRPIVVTGEADLDPSTPVYYAYLNLA
jgi:hypothetical protein